MKTNLIMLCLAAGCAFGLSSCGKSTPTKSTPTFSDDTEKNAEIINDLSAEKKAELEKAAMMISIKLGNGAIEIIRGKSVDEVIEYAHSL